MMKYATRCARTTGPTGRQKPSWRASLPASRGGGSAGASPANSHGAFTLVELLVVITILAVLAALLMPALKSARDQAKDAKCISNQRQISAGMWNYLGDHDGYFPYQFPINKGTFALTNPATGQPCTPTSGYSWSCANSWYAQFAPYIGGLGKTENGLGPYSKTFFDVMRCPRNPFPTSNFNDPAEYYGAQSAPGMSWSPSSYSLNSSLIPLTWGKPQGIGPGCGYKWDSPSGFSKRPNLRDIQNPSSAALLLENPLCPQRGGRVDTPWYGLGDLFFNTQPMPFYGGGGLYGGINATMITNYCGVADARRMYDWLRPDCNYMVSTFHNLGMHVLFFDGHAARVPKATLISYAADTQSGGYCGGSYTGLKNTPGGIFWTDGFGISVGGRFFNQFPGYDLY